MNILISSALLALALCLVAGEIGRMATALHPKQKKPQNRRVQPQKSRPAVDWDRIMMETKLEKGGKRK